MYDIDDLQGIVEANLAERKRAAEEIGLMIEGEIIAFKEWFTTLGVVPMISALRKKAIVFRVKRWQVLKIKCLI